MGSPNQPVTGATKRKAQLNLVAGVNGTGKTTFLLRNVVQRTQKALVLTPDDMEWQSLPTVSTPTDIYNLRQPSRIIYTDGILDTIARCYFGGPLILDDAMAYLNHQTPDTLRYIYIRRRQRGVDIYLVTHGLRQIPPQAFSFASYLILFATTENFSARRRDLQPEIYDAVADAQDEVNRLAHSNPYAYRVIAIDPQLR